MNDDEWIGLEKGPSEYDENLFTIGAVRLISDETNYTHFFLIHFLLHPTVYVGLLDAVSSWNLVSHLEPPFPVTLL